MKNLDGKSKLYALFASPCEHSLSPLIHNSAFEKMNINAAYMAFDVNLDRIADAVYSMRTLGISGANVSMPNKTAILKYLDEISDEEKELSENILFHTNDENVSKFANFYCVKLIYSK